MTLRQAKGTELSAILLGRRLSPQRSSLETMLTIAIACLKALEDLHNKKIVHFDLKPSNIFFDGDTLRASLIDLGMSHRCGEPLKKMGGTPSYIAPEVSKAILGNKRYKADPKADVYAMAGIVYELILGAAPQDRTGCRASILKHIPFNFAGLSNASEREALGKRLRLVSAEKSYLQKNGEDLKAILCNMSRKDPKKRISLQAAIKELEDHVAIIKQEKQESGHSVVGTLKRAFS